MTDRVTEALLAALKQALAAGAEQRLVKSGKLDGLFPGRVGAAGAAAARALDEGLLEVVRTEVRGKAEFEWVRLTPRGVEFLHEHESPVHALHELRDTLRANQQAIPVWLADIRAGLQAMDERLTADAQKWSQRLEALTRRVEDTLRRFDEATPLLPPELPQAYPWCVDALNYLDRRRSGTTGDCPLPELFRALSQHHPALSVSIFHEGLRRMHDRRVLRLKPAEGAALTQPEFALLEGGTLLYFAAR